MDDWILLRGLVRESRHWGGFVHEFEQVVPNAHAVLLDLPGNGARCSEVSPATVREMVEAYRAQLCIMGKSAPYRILAISMGGMVAAEWSRRYPDEVAMQVLINTSMRPFSSFYRRLRPANYLPLLWLLATRAQPVQWETAILRMTTNHPHEEVLSYWCALRAQSPVAVKSLLRQLWAAATYRASTAPPAAATLVLASAQDRLVSVDCSRALASRWQVPLAIHPSAGHDLTLDGGLWVAQQVQGWLDNGVRS
ncbi:MAG: alpha/beta hydrolase [Burkholderiales bacterium]|nr:alpha/beta hydrolase [Burkholderiales bacterium]